MEYENAKRIYGTLIRPVDASRRMKVTAPAIYDFFKSGRIRKITVMINGISRTFVPEIDVEKYIAEKELKIAEVCKKTNNLTC